MRGLLPIIALAAVGLAAACGGGRSGSLAPADPTETVRTFLDATKDSNLTQMAQLWGGRRGPVIDNLGAYGMDEDELRKRLTVIQIYLAHDRYELVQATGLAVAGGEGRRGVTVRLFRSGCIANVPFTLAPWSGRWLVNDIDLSTVGNPARSCPTVPAQPPGTG
jgi:hypothetical protein